MTKIKIEFFHDTICSFCYPMSYRMREIEREFGDNIEIIHRSFALVKDEEDFNRMFGSREYAKTEIMHHWKNANKEDTLHRFNIEGMKDQDFLFPISMPALYASKAAYMLDGNNAYWEIFDGLQKLFFTENKNIEDEKVIFKCIEESSLDYDAWVEKYNSAEVKELVKEDLELAVSYGITGVPTIVVNEEEKINGLLSISNITNIIEKYKK